MEKTYKAENKHPELGMDELTEMIQENAKKIQVLNTPALMIEGADIFESMAFRMLEQSDRCKQASEVISKNYIDIFKKGGFK